MEQAKRIFELQIKRLVESYMHCHGLVSHQLESYEHFVHFMLPEIIMEHSPITIHCPKQKVIHRIFLSNMCIKKPTIQEANGFIRELRPKEAHLRKQTYCFDVFLDVEHKVYKTSNGIKFKLIENKLYQNVLFCKIPCMLNSSTCHTYKDFAYPQRNSGTFIINGYEKVIITQEKLRCNFPYVFPIKRAAKYTYRCEVRSFHSSKIRSTSTLNIYISAEKTTSVPEISLLVPFIKHYIPLPVIFRLLDVCDIKSMMYYIVGTAPNCSQKLRYKAQSILCTDSSNTINMSADELYDWIGLKGSTEKQHKKRIQYIKHIFINEFLPHCGNDYSTDEKTAETNAQKAFYLGYCVRKLLMVSLDEIPPDDIDHYTNKRCCATGLHFALLMRQLIRNFIKMLHVQVFKAVNNNKYINIVDFFNQRKISAGIKYACATGNWGIQKGMTNQSGICQVISNMNLSSRLSHLRLVNTPINRDGKLPRPRQLHRSHLGILCAAETPEGKSVGLLNQLAFLTRIRIGCPSRFIIELLVEDMGVIPLVATAKVRNLTLVLVNGIICGGVRDPVKFVQTYKKYRQWFSVPIDSSITYRESHKEVSILTDAEDCYRPLIRADKLPRLLTLFKLYGEYLHILWTQLLIDGVVEYINKEEESTLYVCMQFEDLTPQHTHLELHPSFTVYGVSAGLIVFSNHNQAPRNIYQSAMGKQAISGQPLGFQDQMDTKTHVLNYPQKPLVTSWTSGLIGFDEDPAGQSCVVAIMCYTGFNQEDSVIINQSALDRGLFNSTFYRAVKDTEVTHGSDVERFDSQHMNVLGKRKADYTKLDETGIVPIAAVIEKDDVIIGKTIEYTVVNKCHDESEYVSKRVKRDRSVVSKNDERATVESVIFSDTKEGLRFVSVKTASPRIPEIGDKFCFTEDHQVLTQNGWIPISKVTMGMRVATLQPESHQLCYQKPLEIMTFPMDNEPMYEVCTQQFTLKTTMNHRMYVKKRNRKHFELVEAKDVFGKRVRFLQNCNGLASYKDPPCPTPIKDSNEFLYFLGFWVGNGWVEKNQYNYRVTICQPKAHTKERIIRSAIDLGLRPFCSDDKIHISYKPLTDFLLPLSVGARNKCLPAFCYNLSIGHSQSLLAGLLDSDGSRNASGALCYYTSSVKLKDDVQQLVLHAGWSANVSICKPIGYTTTIKGRVITANYDQWQVRINRRKNQPPLNHGYVSSQSGQWERVTPFTGNVHCLTVPNHVLYVRRLGKSVWCGNSSRHGQKGIVGMTYRHEDMPFTADGIVPDIIVNCHAIPSRMTVAQLLETHLGKVSCIEGKIADGTAFRKVTAESINERTLDHFGKEIMYNGKTGQMLKKRVFIGVAYYQRLRHMVQDKLHARAKGPNQILTRQPVEGRSRKGGFRMGEMERDALICHGAAAVIQDRLLHQSDKYRTFICQTCGFLAEPNAPEKIQIVNVLHKNPYCRYCKSNDNIYPVEIPYAFKLLTQELGAVHLGLKFKLSV